MTVVVTLPSPDIGLFVDFEATRVVLPRLSAHTRTQIREQAYVRFEGDVDETAFRGEGRPRTIDLATRFRDGEHGIMADLLDLLELSQTAPDGRLMVRLTSCDDPRLNAVEVVMIPQDVGELADWKTWDVSFTARRVNFTLEV